eukprot:scaffold50640_cov33-Phaeocystis_antarctica.AAC.1
MGRQGLQGRRVGLRARSATCEICASLTPSITNWLSLSSSHTSAREPSPPGSLAAASRTRASSVTTGGRSLRRRKWSRALPPELFFPMGATAECEPSRST